MGQAFSRSIYSSIVPRPTIFKCFNDTELVLTQVFTIFVGPRHLTFMHRCPTFSLLPPNFCPHQRMKKRRGLPPNKGMREYLVGEHEESQADLRDKYVDDASYGKRTQSTPKVSDDPNVSRSKGGMWEERLTFRAS